MRKLLLATAALGSVLALPAIAEAASGFSTANVNMRSGPSTAYPAVTLIPIGAPLRINGCLADLPWCDVSFDGGRGWVAGRYVQAVYQQRRIYVGPQYYRPLGIPTITFDLDNYWDRNYRGRNFYRDRDRWAQGPDWQRNGGQPIYRRPPPPPVYDPQDEDQGNWQRRHQRQPDYDGNYQGDDNPPPRHRPRYGDGDAGQRYGDPDQGNFDGDNNQPPRRRQQQDQQDQQQPQQQQRPQRDQPPQGQPPRQQPPQAQPQPPQPPQQPAPPPPRAQPEAPRPQPQPQAQQPSRSEPPRVIRRNDGQVIVCPDAGPACNEPHSSHN
ncbi:MULTISPECIES: SH3 domain-containing protein [unclassified Rhizobium]|uniref:SH3 domain-containing protein n=1 Tax=unclassified Rhizobium TaxID=2613769 RepID=UPI001ADA052C|nr:MULTISPECIES: SH3 domain-containing protein [unclassified Rhizobium]MBO9096660.1 SH3 domain-containing protein [Rhizobium sp. L58/93]MBO9166916.1 SH3 domain-containing protein [Rhizobium sp. L245/93]MBO9182888.1 SH3 domain-containing protein [Rhizobium sp. E27B/91]QXZ82633.1 SH3 domain-containing protein [Rhizobium sp. K1/93]QXZ89854.1 SH3 domain-containing protein [Rhizobium sp. K15/93]